MTEGTGTGNGGNGNGGHRANGITQRNEGTEGERRFLFSLLADDRVALFATIAVEQSHFLAISVGVDLAPRPTMYVDPSEFNDVTGRILGAAIEVHRALGAGLLESIYMTCLQFELTARNLRYVAQRVVPIVYKGMEVQACYRVDLIVEDMMVVEVKSTAALLPVHQSQLLTYMGLTDCPAGLLINFNVPRLMDGVKRMINPRAGVKPPMSQ